MSTQTVSRREDNKDARNVRLSDIHVLRIACVRKRPPSACDACGLREWGGGDGHKDVLMIQIATVTIYYYYYHSTTPPLTVLTTLYPKVVHMVAKTGKGEIGL